MVVGTLLYGLVGHRVHRRTAVLVALGGTALPLIAMAIAAAAAVDAGAGLHVSGLLFGPVNPVINVVMQERSPERMRGRVLGVFTSSAYAAGPLGLLLAGPLVDHLGVEGAFMTLALALTVVGLGHDRAARPARPRPSDGRLAPGAEPKPHAEPQRGRGQGDSKPPTSRPTGHPAGRHDAPTPAGTAHPAASPVGSSRGTARRSATPWRVRRDLIAPRGQDGRVHSDVPPDETAAARILDLLGARRGPYGLRPARRAQPARSGACHPAAGRPRILPVRHEQTAGYAADGLARATGGLGVALTTTGPGAANAVAAFGEAATVHSPVLLVASEVPLRVRRAGDRTRCPARDAPTRARCSPRWPRRSSAPPTPTRPWRWRPTPSRSHWPPRPDRSTWASPSDVLGAAAAPGRPCARQARTAPDLRAVEAAVGPARPRRRGS